jgi:hypothetical protein
VEFRGGDDFQRLARKLEAAAAADVVTRAISSAIERSAPELEAAVHAGTQRLPQRGGLASRVAGTRIQRRIRHSRGFFSLRLIALPNAVADPGAINRGRVKHPTYGHGPHVVQLVPKGWFTEPLKAAAPMLRARVEAALRSALKGL